MRLAVALPFAFLMMVPLAVAARADGDLCTSPEFRDAFFEGQVTGDYPSMSTRLIAYGDAAVPCLKQIIIGQGVRLGLSQCGRDGNRCPGRAMAVLGRIGTPAAQDYLAKYLRSGKDRRLLVVAIMSLGNLRTATARPELKLMLENSDPEIRARAVVSLGVIGKPEDFDSLLKTTLELPPEQLYTGAQGLVKFGDARAIQPLEECARTLTDEIARGALQSAISQLRAKTHR